MDDEIMFVSVEEIDSLGLTPEQKDALMKSIERGQKQFEAGKGIPGEEVTAWLRSWGTENELPPPSPRGTIKESP